MNLDMSQMSDGFTTVDSLIIKWAHAIKGLKDTETTYLEFTARLDSEWADDWTELVDNTSIEGGESYESLIGNLRLVTKK